MALELLEFKPVFALFSTMHTPELARLDQHLETMSYSYPGRHIIADTPFLIFHDGKVCTEPTWNPDFALDEEAEGREVLWTELFFIAHYLSHDYYTAYDLELLELNAAEVCKQVKRMTRKFEMEFVRSLRKKRRLH